MLKRYRKRFIASTMCLVSLVLLAALGVQFVIQYRNAWTEMRNTMSLVAGPWDKPGEAFRPVIPGLPDEQEAWGEDERWMSAGNGRQEPPRMGREKIVTVFYNAVSDEISILDREQSERDSSLIIDAVKEALSMEKDFGVLPKSGLIYYREKMQETAKFAFSEVSYLRDRLLRSFLVLLLVFFVTLGFIYLISLWLARRAAEPMERAIDMERQFVADISHDLKTPITVILANNSILRAGLKSKVEDNLQWIDSTDEAAKNMMQMIGQMLTLSSLESVEQTAKRESVDLSHAAEKSILQLESIAYDHSITIETEIARGVFYPGDREYAERICTGLVENALKYEPEGGQIRVILSRQKKKALFRVENAGSVIEPEDLPHVFERFYRGDKTRSGQNGHGLGLPIIKQMTELQGGEIQVESSAGHGTAFTVSFSADDA